MAVPDIMGGTKGSSVVTVESNQDDRAVQFPGFDERTQ
jgi:hypothetical protein